MLCLSGGGFQFGGASAFGATNNASGVFTFGAGSAASPAPSANASITPQSGAPGGGFNFAQPPTFNIGYVALSQLICQYYMCQYFHQNIDAGFPHIQKSPEIWRLGI